MRKNTRTQERALTGAVPWTRHAKLTGSRSCEGCVVDRDPTVLQHQLKIAVADREHEIPAHGPQDHLGRELPAFELFALPHATRAAIRLVETVRLSNPDPPHKLATDPFQVWQPRPMHVGYLAGPLLPAP